MIDLGLLLGHLFGDYIFQNDWMAKNKSKLLPGTARPDTEEAGRPWDEATWQGLIGLNACSAHCLLYTACVYGFSYGWMPWWGLVLCFVCHFLLDRYRLAFWWMTCVSGQAEFARGPLAPWSIILVDNVFHLYTLYLIRCLAVYMGV